MLPARYSFAVSDSAEHLVVLGPHGACLVLALSPFVTLAATALRMAAYAWRLERAWRVA